MLIGIVAVIHEAVEELQRAMSEFRSLRVDLVVSLGDACDTFSPAGRASEVVALLRGAGAVGVWGNHDVGLCSDITDPLRREAGPEVLCYMAGMHPQLVVAGCCFSHVEPWAKLARKKAHAQARDPDRRAKIAAAKRGRARPTPPDWVLNGTAWTEEADELVRTLPPAEAAGRASDPLGSVYTRRYELGVSQPREGR